MNLLKTHDLAVGYDDEIVVDNINLEALKGQVICLLGPNGSGKTTILRSLSGLLSPLKGTVRIKEKDLAEHTHSELARELAVVLTERFSGGLMTAREVIAMGRHPHTGLLGRLKKEDRRKIAESLKLVGAEELAERYFSQLSDGEKQKILLARALAQDPELIVLDEPTTHLDVRHRVEVMDILNRMAEEKNITVIMSLHEVDLALKSCQILLLIKDGEIKSIGPPGKIVKEGTITRLYDIECASFNHNLGTMELIRSNLQDRRVFVVPGAGCGVDIFRGLARRGYRIAAGVLHRGDVDHQIASAVNACLVEEKAFSSISETSLARAQKLIKDSDAVVDSGFPAGECNKENFQLLKSAVDFKKPLYTLREKNSNQLTSGIEGKAEYCSDTSELLQKLEKAESAETEREESLKVSGMNSAAGK